MPYSFFAGDNFTSRIMNDLTVQLREEKAHFLPGSKIAGTAIWSFEEAPTSVEIRLYWMTAGTAPQQVGLVAKVVGSRLQRNGSYPFEFTLPHGPWSFDGNLFHLGWALDVVLLPSRACTMRPFVLSPTGQSIRAVNEEPEAL